MSEAKVIARAGSASRRLEEVTELLPAGKVPGGFERDFCQIFRPEIEARFHGAPAAKASSK